jgi:hypothetical protein
MDRIACRASLIWLTTAVLVLTACASSSLGRAKQIAASNYETYQTITPQVVEHITAIVERGRNGTITDADRERLRSLKHLQDVLDAYAAVHNQFIEALQAWERTNRKPDDEGPLESRAADLLNQARARAADLKLRLR